MSIVKTFAAVKASLCIIIEQPTVNSAGDGYAGFFVQRENEQRKRRGKNRK
jgi:hypothetical protein